MDSGSHPRKSGLEQWASGLISGPWTLEGGGSMTPWGPTATRGASSADSRPPSWSGAGTSTSPACSTRLRPKATFGPHGGRRAASPTETALG
eukprot:8442777-Pyramimonas_sp.AAC.1